MSDTTSYRPLKEKSEDAPPRADCGSVVFVLVSNFCLAIQYSLLMPTVWKYLKDMGSTKIMLGCVLAAFTIAQVVFMPLIGKIGDRIGTKKLYGICYALAVIGSFAYGIAGKLNSPWMCLAARFIAGLGASANVLNTACVTKWSRPEDLNRNMNVYLSIRMIGNIVGPAFTVAFTHVNFTMLGFVEIKDTTCAGYVMIIPNAILLLMSLLVFKEPKTASKALTTSASQSEESDDSDDTTLLAPATSQSTSKVRTILVDRGGWFCLMLQFTGCCSIGAMETALTPITDKLNWSTSSNSVLFVVISLVIFAAIAFSLLIAKCDGDTARARVVRPRRLITIGMVFGLIGIVFLFAYEIIFGAIQSWSLFAFAVLAGFPIPLLIGPTNAIYASKLEKGSKGQFMSYVGISQALGRSLGPLAGSLAVSINSRHFYPIAIVSFLTWVVPPMSLRSMWTRLEVDMNSAVQDNDDEDVEAVESMSTPVDWNALSAAEEAS